MGSPKDVSKALIIGFEPYPQLADFCSALTCYDRVYKVALGASSGKTTLFINESDSGWTATTGGNTLVEYTSGKAEVVLDRLDSIISSAPLPKPDFIKLDVDGGELDVIAGGLSAFRHASCLGIECVGRDRAIAVKHLLQAQSVRKVGPIDYLFSMA